MENNYFFLRHGQSKANVGGFVLSHPEHGKHEDFSLTEVGEKQVRNSVLKVKDEGLLDNSAIIYSSPFSRCRKTAEIARDVLGVDNKVIIDERLRERWFGDLERTSSDNYEKVWAEDKKDHLHKVYNVERLEDVKDRVVELIYELEKKYKNKKIIIVSHGDPLQITQTFMQGKSLTEHRSIEHLQTAEVRKLKLKK